MESFKNWMTEAANIMFDDSKNDLRSLPKSVRLQILIVLSFVWSTVFSLYVFSVTSFIFGWAGVVMAHIGLIIAVYLTFKFFHKKQEQPVSVFQSGNYNPAKIFAVFFIVFFCNHICLPLYSSISSAVNLNLQKFLCVFCVYLTTTYRPPSRWYIYSGGRGGWP